MEQLVTELKNQLYTPPAFTVALGTGKTAKQLVAVCICLCYFNDNSVKCWVKATTDN